MIQSEAGKTRFIDTGAESHDHVIHSVEVHQEFITYFCKRLPDGWWNRGCSHDRGRFHAEEGGHERWIAENFDGKLATDEAWNQHIHFLIDGPRWQDFADYREHMSDSLAGEIKEWFEEN